MEHSLEPLNSIEGHGGPCITLEVLVTMERVMDDYGTPFKAVEGNGIQLRAFESYGWP